MRQSQLIFAAVLLLAGCTKEKRDAPPGSLINPQGASNFASLQADIFSLSCATSGCHDNRPNPAAGLDLSSRQASYAALVDVTSTQLPSKKLVVANDPGNSYFLAKLDGRYSSMGGSGFRMPQFAAALSPSETDRIINWINNGAQND